jgi:hypothetical protein
MCNAFQRFEIPLPPKLEAVKIGRREIENLLLGRNDDWS